MTERSKNIHIVAKAVQTDNAAANALDAIVVSHERLVAALEHLIDDTEGLLADLLPHDKEDGITLVSLSDARAALAAVGGDA